MYNPKVYVGTYKKYNNGSLAGGWVSLNECNDYQAFLRKCRALHRGERDPEFMIQDNEDFPDGLDCMDWLSEHDFNEVKLACNESENEFNMLSPAERLRNALLCNITAPKNTVANETHTPAMYKAWLEEFFATEPNMVDHYRKCSVGALKMHEGFYLIEKPRIENNFCFHDEGSQYDLYWKLMEDKEQLASYFKRKNLSRFDDVINRIEKGTIGGDKRVWWNIHKDSREIYICFGDHFSVQENDGITLCTDEEKGQLLAAVKWGRELFSKRLDSYLKRYGVSKLHTWTYWADA